MLPLLLLRQCKEGGLQVSFRTDFAPPKSLLNAEFAWLQNTSIAQNLSIT